MKKWIEKINLYYYNSHTQKIGTRLLFFIIDREKNINKNQIQNYMIHIYQTKKANTYKTYYAFISSFLNKLYKDKEINFILNDLNLPKIKEDQQIAPSLLKRIEKEQIELLLKKLQEKKNYLFYYFIKVLANSGLRTQEAKDLNLSNQFFIGQEGLFNLYHIKGKGGKFRIIYLPSQLMMDIEKKLGINPFLTIQFPTMFLKRFCMKHNLKVFTPHQIRSFYGTYLLETKGLALNIVANLLGHSSVHTTARFYLRNKLDTTKLIMM